MSLRFTKMHGAGNDFVIIDTRDQDFAPEPGQIRHIADRRTGIGCDQVLVLAAPEDARHAVAYRIFNAAGAPAEQCGNGARCIAALAGSGAGRTAADGGTLILESPAGLVEARLLQDGAVAVNMGKPDFEPAAAGFDATRRSDSYALQVGTQHMEIGVVSMGNPHAVLEVADVATAEVGRLGPGISGHARFAGGANTGFVEVAGKDWLRLRVFERGAGETLACGTGACAAAAVMRVRGRTGEQVSLDLPGGRLMVSWTGPGAALWLTGPARQVFTGTIDL